jgi:hypothetical protein
VTADDREYVRRPSEATAEANAEAVRAHLALSPADRMRRSIAMKVAGRGYARDDLRTDDDPSKFYELAKQRGPLPRLNPARLPTGTG